MEVIQAKIATTKSLYLPLDEAILMPIGDIHYGGGGDNDPCDVDRLKRRLDWGMNRGAYFLGMGDYIDVASPSNRNALVKAGFYDSMQQLIEDAGSRLLDRLLDVLKGTEGRWLGLLEGHHYFDFEDGTTSDVRLCQALKAPFLGDCAFVQLVFRYPESKTASHHDRQRAHATIWCHHGMGGGRLAGAPLNVLEHIIKVFDADIYLMGHQHKKVAAPLDRIYINWHERSPVLHHRRIILACTGGFLKGYMQGSKNRGRAQGTYVEQRMLSPTALGGLTIYIRPRRDTTGSKDRYHLDLGVEQ